MREPILIISDLHLAHPGCRIKSVESLAPLFEGAGTVILNGDTCEQRHRDWLEDGRRQLEKLRALLDRSGVRETILLRGNHDPEISETDHLDLADGRVFATHGDAIFRHLSPWSPKIWPVIPEMEKVRAVFGEERLASDLEARLACAHRCRTLSAGTGNEFETTGRFSTLRSLARIAWPPRRPLGILKTWATIPRDAHDFFDRYRPGARVMLFGHTHLPGYWGKRSRLAINTGGFMSIMPARGVEIAGEIVEVFAIEETPGAVRRGRTLRRIGL